MSAGFPENQDQDALAMRRLAEGHDTALTELMERHGGKLFRFLSRTLQNEAEAGDLAEETFVRVYQHRQRFDSQRKFSTWLYAIAANLVRDKFRWRTRHPEVSRDAPDESTGAAWLEHLPDPGPTPGEYIEKAERARAVRKAIAALPEELRTPLILAEYEALSHAEIAEIAGCSAKAVEMRIYRARKQLRDELAELLKEA